ncbi:prolyl oligopeptidase family serine peptidase [Paenibacillus lutimineralis]|uniref:S9 family peptidase n=1 Tax=Paenibacillus lutimineralis TaxID=2707005 RepID=A0A3S9UZD8_9BACL|nr:prolyl oligopeptidase family serine peptidase [Paenibacillus lutimineralis]AZS15457.1 S9 family peptidase [Paenibacillus lutimineralis]
MNARKRLVSAVIAAIMAVSVPVSVMAQDGAKKAAPWYQDGVQVLVTKGIIDKGVKQNQEISVKDFIRYAVMSLTYQHGIDPMKVASEKGWLKEGEFTSVDAPIKRGEMARMMVRALGKEQGETSLAEYVASAKALGLIQGDADGSLHEDQPVTVAQAAVVLKNYSNKMLSTMDDRGVSQISVEDFMRSPGSFGYELSPDGKYLSYAGTWENRSNVFVEKIGEKSEPIRVTSSKDRDIAGFFWKGDNILYRKDKGGDENFHVYSSTFNGNKEVDLTPYDKVSVQIVSDLSGVKDEILISMNKEDATIFDVYKLNVKTGETKLIAKNPGNIMEWVADRQGKIRLASESDGIVSTLLYRDTEEEAFKPLVTLNNGDTMNPLGFSADGKSIYAVSNNGRDKTALVKLNLKGEEEVLYQHPEVDVTGAYYDKNQDKMLAAVYVTDKAHLEFFDDKFEAMYRKLQQKLGVSESEIGLNDYNEDMTKLIVSVSNDKTYGMYYFYDSVSGELTSLGNLSPWLKPDQMADMYPISYKSRDGLTIHGYLTLPKNKKPQNLPMIINPHGGPWTRDTWGFNPEVQLLANRGYAVLQMNFRASMGYGKSFRDAGNKQWGLKIQDDITDGVKWAIQQGIADPKRVGIYGGSFGGYATLTGITKTPELYAAAVDYVGVSNMFSFLGSIPPYWETMRNLLNERVGDVEKDKEMLKQVSPVFHVDKIVTPLFVAQGANDPRVNKAESDQIVEALKKRGVQVEYMVKDDEGHGFANEENLIDFYNTMIKFLDKYLKPQSK